MITVTITIIVETMSINIRITTIKKKTIIVEAAPDLLFFKHVNQPLLFLLELLCLEPSLKKR